MHLTSEQCIVVVMLFMLGAVIILLHVTLVADLTSQKEDNMKKYY